MENHLNMSNQFTTYEIALALKELGFDEECIGFYYNENNFEIAIPDVVKVICDKFNYIKAPLWQQVIDFCDSKELLVGTIIVDNLYKSTINKINYETELFNSRNESIKRAIEFAISYLQNNK